MKTTILMFALFVSLVAGTAHADQVVIECVQLEDDGKSFNGIKEVLIIDLEKKLIEYVGTPSGTDGSLWFHITEASDAEIHAEERNLSRTNTLTINRFSLQMQVVWDWSVGNDRHLEPTWYKCEKGRSRPQI